MSVYRRNDSPFWHYDFQYKGRRFHGSTEEADKGAAGAVEQRARDRARRDAAGGTAAARPVTLDAACGEYWTAVAVHQATAGTTEYQLENLIEGLGRASYLHEIGDAAIAGYVARARGRANARATKSRRLLAPATVNREIQLLRRVINRAGTVHRARTAAIAWARHMLREPDKRQRILKADEETRLLAELAGHLRPPLRFSLLTGVRLSQAIGLDWSEIDLRAREITLHVKSRRHLAGKVLVLPVTGRVLELLAGLGPRAAGRVFLRRGRPIKSWRTAWQAAKRRAGLADLRWHDLRHTVGARLVRAGVDISVVQEILGHADIATTRRYLEVDTADKRRGLERLESQESPEISPSFKTADRPSD